MGNLDPTKIAIVLIVALLVLGPEKLPGFVKQAGAWWGEFERVKSRLQAEVNGAVNQINSVAAPFTETFNSASSSVGGFVQSVFAGVDQQQVDTASAQNNVSPSDRKGPAIVAQSNDKDALGWGDAERESGYHYGDPRLN